MKSLLRFLIFVAFLGMAVALLYFWRKDRPGNGETGTPASSLTVASRLPSLTALDAEFTSLVNHVLPSVVSINAIPPQASDPRMQLLRLLQGANATPDMGSGVVVSREGHIVTNLHVISRAGTVEVHLNDGRALLARLVGSDALSDIAILKIEADGLQPLDFGDSDKVNVGQMVFAVGNPLGLQETVTQGIISAKGRRANSEAANEFFQTDAAINQGNSGGPLISLNGEIIGINNSVAEGQGIGFAIPSNTVRRVFEEIRDHGRFIRPWFGAYMRPLTPQMARQMGLPNTDGAMVLITYDGSPAERSGLKPRDIIVEYDGKPIRDHIDLRNRVAESSIGQNVTMRVRRGSQVFDLQTLITAEPDA